MIREMSRLKKQFNKLILIAMFMSMNSIFVTAQGIYGGSTRFRPEQTSVAESEIIFASFTLFSFGLIFLIVAKFIESRFQQANEAN